MGKRYGFIQEEHHVQCLAFELTRWLISHPLDLGVVAGGMKRRKEKSEAQRIADRRTRLARLQLLLAPDEGSKAADRSQQIEDR
jgi:hypothetical protein